MPVEKFREKMLGNLALIQRLKDAGFFYCSGVIFTGDSFDQETCTWRQNSQRIGEVVWVDGKWVVKPYDVFAHLFGGDFFAG